MSFFIRCYPKLIKSVIAGRRKNFTLNLQHSFFAAGSLFPHNVVLVPLGDDFLYTHEQEWDQQYGNYKMIIDYINAHSDEYHAEVK